MKDIKKIAQDILDRKIDALEGISELGRLNDDSMSKLGLMISGITSETDHLIPISPLISKKLEIEQEEWKVDYVKDSWPLIKEICETVIKQEVQDVKKNEIYNEIYFEKIL
jgi:hypothetical protein